MTTEKTVFARINELADELGTAASHRQELTQEISDLEAELDAIDAMLDDAADRDEYDAIMEQRKAAELDLRFARNRLRRFDQSPRIDPEKLTDLLNQLSAEADDAATRWRQKVEKPLADIITAGDAFDATINAIRESVCKLASVDGRVTERDKTLRRLFSRFELGNLRSRAYMDNRRTVHPDLRDALRLSSTATQAPFDTH